MPEREQDRRPGLAGRVAAAARDADPRLAAEPGRGSADREERFRGYRQQLPASAARGQAGEVSGQHASGPQEVAGAGDE